MLHRGSNCSLVRAMDGHIVRCGNISSCQSAAMLLSMCSSWSSAISSIGPLAHDCYVNLLATKKLQVQNKHQDQLQTVKVQSSRPRSRPIPQFSASRPTWTLRFWFGLDITPLQSIIFCTVHKYRGGGAGSKNVGA